MNPNGTLLSGTQADERTPAMADYNEKQNKDNGTETVETLREKPFTLVVEICVFVITLGAYLTASIGNNLILQRTCSIILGYNETTCQLLDSTNKTDLGKDIEKQCQIHTTKILMVLSVTGAIVPAVLALFCGPWSNNHGRKPLILCPLFGIALNCLLSIIFVLVPSLNPWWLLLTVLTTLLGNAINSGMGCGLYLTDTTKAENRSMRFAVMNGSSIVGGLIGNLASSYLLAAVGYAGIYAICLIMYAICFIYVMFFVEESLSNPQTGGFFKVFEMQHLKDMWNTVFKRRNKLSNIALLCIVLSYTLYIFVYRGLSNVEYMHTRRKFQWLLKDYTIFTTISTIVNVAGIGLAMGLVKRCFKVQDAILAVVAFISMATEAFVKCISFVPWEMYLAGALGIFGGLPNPLLRALSSNVVSKGDIAEIFALMMCAEAIVPTFAHILFDSIYAATLEDFPGTVYAFAAGIYGVCLVLCVLLYLVRFRSGFISHDHEENINNRRNEIAS